MRTFMTFINNHYENDVVEMLNHKFELIAIENFSVKIGNAEEMNYKGFVL